MGLVDGADTALSSLAIRHEGLPLHGHINTDTVLATTKFGRPLTPVPRVIRLNAPCPRNPALPTLSSPDATCQPARAGAAIRLYCAQ